MQVRLNKEQKIRLEDAGSVYKIMQQVLLREQKIDRNREHFWVIGLATDNTILYVELISLGSVNKALVEPMEVYSFALQKRSVKIILIHNHPSGHLKPSESDQDITDRMIQVGLIVNVPVIDHLIISEREYYSFVDSGLLKKLEQSKKYVPAYKLEALGVAKGKVEGQHQKAIGMAKAMQDKGYPITEISELTGLTEDQINQLKEKSPGSSE